MGKSNKQNWLKTKVITAVFVNVLTFSGVAQFAAPAGQLGTSAVHQDSSSIVSWGMNCAVVRGKMDVSGSIAGNANVGTEQSAIGKADGLDVVSLGDGGTAIVEFDPPITNGSGADFAVFENSFSNDFLELAFVEVSSDGVQFVRFPATSLTDTSVQVDTYGTLDATKINNLAGKYRAAFGTPFDLEELKDSVGLDVNSIRFVKIIDVVGSVNSVYASYDHEGRKINDPWPTPFASSGFDLDAVAGINVVPSAVNILNSLNSITVFPNPARGEILLAGAFEDVVQLELLNLNGTIATRFEVGSALLVNELQNGLYILKIRRQSGVLFKKVMIKNE